MSGIGVSLAIKGTGAAFPKNILSSQELGKKLGLDEQWIIDRTGIRQRAISDPNSPNESLVALASQSAKQALQAAGWKPDEIDLVVVATCSARQQAPAIAYQVQALVGAGRAWAFDLNAACSGFVFGLATVEGLLKAGRGKRALLIGADVLSPYLDWNDSNTCVVFGDGAGAAALEVTTSSDRTAFVLKSDGGYQDLISIPSPGNFFQMKGREVFKLAVDRLASSIQELLKENQLKVEDVQWLIPHQGNVRILNQVSERLKWPKEKVISTIAIHANTASASIPTALDSAVREGKIKRGDVLVFAGFGAGINWGAALLKY